MHDALKRGEKNLALFLGKHDGECTSNSMNGPSVMEEFMLEDLGQELLADKDGNCLGGNLALFMCCPTSDGDSKESNQLAQAQFHEISEEAHGQSEKLPCSTHVGENLNKSHCNLQQRKFCLNSTSALPFFCICSQGNPWLQKLLESFRLFRGRAKQLRCSVVWTNKLPYSGRGAVHLWRYFGRGAGSVNRVQISFDLLINILL